MNLLGFLTAVFLVAVIAVECLSLEKNWARVARMGLFVTGVPWISFLLAGTLGQPIFLLLIPALYLGVGGGWVRHLSRRRQEEEQDLKESGGWRCPSCQRPNAAVNAVCYQCQAPRR